MGKSRLEVRIADNDIVRVRPAATNGKFQPALRTDSFNSMFGFGIILRSQTLDSLSYKDKPRNSNLIDFPFSGLLSGGEKSTISGFLPFVSFHLRICTLGILTSLV